MHTGICLAWWEGMKTLRAVLPAFALFAIATISPAWAAPDDGTSFDRQAAASVLSSVDLTKCRATNAPRGEGHVMVTFNATGSATNAVVDKGPMVGTPV